MNPALARHLDWFTTLSPATLDDIDGVYADGASFRDPFNAIKGRSQIKALYARMFRSLAEPRFVIGEVISDGDKAFVTWDFTFAMMGKPQCIHGGTLFVLGSDGRIVDHRDYWDAAEGLYEKLPLLGGVLRCLKRRMA